MGFLSAITDFFMGENEREENGIEIIDGRVTYGDTKISEDDFLPEKIKWSDQKESFKVWMKENGAAERTASGYAYDISSYGVDPLDLTIELIEKKNEGLAITTKRQKVVALRKYGEYLAAQGEYGLHLTLLGYKVKREQEVSA